MRLAAFLAAFGLVCLGATLAQASPEFWKLEWPKTDFEKTSVDFKEIFSGGPPKDGIPAINDPKFAPVAEIDDIPDTEPVVGVTLGGETKAYPLRILMWHEIVNDRIGGIPVAVTFCPLCNAAVVFDGRLGDKVLDFGTTGKLRNSDLVMYDRQTESWWQQFTATAIVGELLGQKLTFVPARLESFANFKKRAPDGLVQIPTLKGLRRYGSNPYEGYDSSSRPFLYRGAMPANVAPLSRVVAIEGKAGPGHSTICATRSGWSSTAAWSSPGSRGRTRPSTRASSRAARTSAMSWCNVRPATSWRMWSTGSTSPSPITPSIRRTRSSRSRR